MRYSPELLDEIRARLPVSRIVERRVKLKRAGREYQGLSPFKTERTPSFTVNDQKGFYHCFASGEHGDIFTFLMKTEGLTFPEAVERLAAEAGVVLPEPAPKDESKASHETRVREALEEACRFFEAALSGKEGEAARAYLARRGVAFEEIKAFRLGYALNSRTSLKAHLSAKGFSLEEMEDAGLLIHGEDIPTSYDRFRGRLIFPISDAKRRVIAFGARALQADQQPKYLNSPETALFHKGRVLFNLAAAREAARKSGSVIVAEGYMDVIALTRGGFPNAVAPLGTALTEDQLRLLWAMAPAPILCFDGDAAGQKAASRALDVALPFLEPERSLQFAFLPEGQDPDDMVSKGAKEALATLLERPMPLFDFLWKREEGLHPLDTPEQRASFEGRLMELAGQVAHKNLRFHYISAIRQRLRSRESATRKFGRPQSPDEAWRARSSSAQGRPHGRGKGPAAPDWRSLNGSAGSATESLLKSVAAQPSGRAGAAREALIVKALLNHPWLLDDYAEEIADIAFEDGDCAALRDQLLALHQSEILLDNKNLLEHLSKNGQYARVERVERAISHHADGNFNLSAPKESVLHGWRHVILLHTKARVLEKALREAEEDYLRDQSGENFSRLCAIRQQVEIALI
jgi:DNA primase